MVLDCVKDKEVDYTAVLLKSSFWSLIQYS